MPVATRYDAVAMTVHWLTVMMILAMLAMGWIMTDLRPGSLLQFQLYQWHKSVGITVLGLSLLRLGWRLAHRPPPLPAAMPRWEQILAHAGHWGLYALLLALPLSGWAVVSASPLNIPTVLYGVLPWPHLPMLADLPVPDRKAAESVLKQLHQAGVWVLLALLAGHVGAALRHHFLLHDAVLTRMLPRFPEKTR